MNQRIGGVVALVTVLLFAVAHFGGSAPSPQTPVTSPGAYEQPATTYDPNSSSAVDPYGPDYNKESQLLIQQQGIRQ